MSLALIGKIALIGIVGVAVATPITYFTTNSSFSLKKNSETKVESEENCRHLPLKNNEIEKRLLVCIQGGGDSKTIFKWREKDNSSEEKIKEIETLSWKKKSDSSSVSFELQVKLKNQGNTVIKADGDVSPFPSVEIEKLEENCSFQHFSSNLFEFQCKSSSDTQGNGPYTIPTYEIKL